jgi:hypothetical protein
MIGFHNITGGRLILLATVLLLLTTLNVGCAPSRPRGPQANEVLDTETVVMLDTGATTQLSRQKEWVETKNGFLEPHIILRNRGGDMLKLEIRTYFKDEYGAIRMRISITTSFVPTRAASDTSSTFVWRNSSINSGGDVRCTEWTR